LLWLWQAIENYNELFPKQQRKKVAFEPIEWKPSRSIRVMLKDCLRPDFQKKQIELLRIVPASHLEKKLEEAGLSGFFLSIRNDKCNNKSITNGATIMFSFSEKGGAQCGDWEVTIRFQIFDPYTTFQAKIFDWLMPTWELNIRDFDEFFADPRSTERLSEIMECPTTVGNYYVSEAEEGRRRLLMIEYFQASKNVFIFVKGEKQLSKFKKSMKLDSLISNARDGLRAPTKKELKV
jgi:hypothetical protein